LFNPLSFHAGSSKDRLPPPMGLKQWPNMVYAREDRCKTIEKEKSPVGVIRSPAA